MTSITSAHCELFYNNTIVKHPSEVFFKIKQGSRPSDYTSAKEFAFKSAKKLPPRVGSSKCSKPPQLDPINVEKNLQTVFPAALVEKRISWGRRKPRAS